MSAAPHPPAETLPRRAFTVADVERMLAVGVLDPDEKFELIGGDVVPMSPQTTLHGVIKTRLAVWFAARLPPDLEVCVETTVRIREQALLDPDVAVITRGPLTRGYLTPDRLRLAIEVADTSLDRDLRKAAEYGAAGLPELWIVDLTARETLVFRTLAGVWTALEPIPFDTPLTAFCLAGHALLIAPLTE